MDLEVIYERQREFEDLVIGKSSDWPDKPLADFSMKERVAFSKELTLYLIKELTELMDAVGNYKMHKSKKDDPKLKEIPEEIADCAIFVLDLALAHGLTCEQFVEAIAQKQDKNFKRQEEGY